jgi:AcrR family transcriptional regulator
MNADEHKADAPQGDAREDIKPKDAREKAVDALMALAAERPWAEISLANVAARAGLSLAQLRDAFPSKGAILGGFSRRIDRAVLAATTDDLAAESAKDRLFDVLMRRFDALKPYKAALEAIDAWAMRDPPALVEINRLVVNSQRFMLEAAGLNSEGPLGAVKLQGLAVAWARVFHVWLSDDSEDLARTMAALDRELERGAAWTERLDDARRTLAPFANPLCRLAERVLGGR